VERAAVHLLDLRERQVADQLAEVRTGAVSCRDRAIVEHDEHAVLRHPGIELERVDTARERVGERRECVLGSLRRAAAMSLDVER
jgi:hypothetical protein